jgi:transcriptional antiterminator NusG
MRPLGIKEENIQIDFAPGDMVVVISGPWAATTAPVSSINMQKKSVTISVEMFGRETPVELGFSEIKKA